MVDVTRSFVRAREEVWDSDAQSLYVSMRAAMTKRRSYDTAIGWIGSLY